MVLAEGVMEMRILKRQGLSVREIARRTGHSRNTVERHLKREGNAVYTARPAVPGKLDAYKAFMSERMIAAHPERLPGTVLLGELRAPSRVTSRRKPRVRSQRKPTIPRPPFFSGQTSTCPT